METTLRYTGALGLVLLTWRTLPQFSDYVVAISSLLAFWHITTIVAAFLRKWLPRKRVHPENKVVVITGCDSGFGHELAKRLDRCGFHVYAGCLYSSGSGAEALKSVCSSRLRILKMDVTNDDDLRAAVKTIKEELNGKDFYALVNNAGLPQGGELEWCSMDLMKKIFEVNTFGVARTTKEFLPLLRKYKGRIVTITSILSRFTLPGCSIYCMSKYSALSFCEGLRLEMKPWGVKVIIIEPWLYRTSITSEKICMDCVNNVWNGMSSSIREDYGNGYLEATKVAGLKFLKMGSHNIHEVVDAFVDAVTAKEPLFYYRPATLEFKFLFWLGGCFPQWLKEYIMTRDYVAQKPAALQKITKAG